MNADPLAPLSRRSFNARCLATLLGGALAASADAATTPSADAGDLAPFFKGYQGAFVMLDLKNGKYVRYNPERCRKRRIPCSTFKIVGSLVGLETRVIPHLDHPLKWDGKKNPILTHNRDHTLRTALRDSVGWYYQHIAEKVGTSEMRRYVKALQYGNGQVSDARTIFWHDSLTISPDEQVGFLLRFYRGELPLIPGTMNRVKEIMQLEKSERGILRGKTGTDGHFDGEELVATLGWFVGWVEHVSGAHIFAANIDSGPNPTGRKARQITEAILKSRRLL